jgi:pimeloyl-ACP methyl ester carboxylesterase
MKAVLLTIVALIGMTIDGTNARALQYMFETKLDHITGGGSSTTFNMRYLVDDQYWRASANDPNALRPILFYAGNEGSVWDFYENSGFMTTTLAKKWGALVVFGEHRYFGQSFPFPRDIAFKSPYNSYLNVEQTMFDYVELIKMIKEKYNAQDKAVMVFGGSYGGMLAAWIRMKYPQTFQGALAASAPILYFKDAPSASPDAFSEIATADFAGVFNDSRCSLGIKEGFELLMDLKNRPDDWAQLSEIFNTCDQIDSAEKIQNLYEHLSNGFLYMAMTDYPYPSAFLEPMPAWPVNASCQAYIDIAPQTFEKNTLGALTEREV